MDTNDQPHPGSPCLHTSDSKRSFIIHNYTCYTLSNYGKNITIVFDGYPEKPTTKQEEQNRRSAKKSSCNIIFEENTKCMTAKEDFLGNRENKKNLIHSVLSDLKKNEVHALLSEGDADNDIVNMALKISEDSPNVKVIGSDTDLLILLVALCPINRNILYYKQSGGKVPSAVIYSIKKLTDQFKEIKPLLLFAYAVTGCDTTSSFFGIGKVKAMEKIMSSQDARDQAKQFLQKDIDRNLLLDSGEKFILNLYGMAKYLTLNEARYFMFTKLTKRSSLRSNFNLAKLPPTSESAHQHLLRVYLQVQNWLGNHLTPSEWGWKICQKESNGTLKNVLIPVTSLKNFAPDDLLKLVSCSCKSTCSSYCGCRKLGLLCTAMCENCNGLSCYNTHALTEDSEEEYDNEK